MEKTRALLLLILRIFQKNIDLTAFLQRLDVINEVKLMSSAFWIVVKTTPYSLQESGSGIMTFSVNVWSSSFPQNIWGKPKPRKVSECVNNNIEAEAKPKDLAQLETRALLLLVLFVHERVWWALSRRPRLQPRAPTSTWKAFYKRGRKCDGYYNGVFCFKWY